MWAILGIAPTRDRAAVRRAYAAKLKQTNPEDDPEGFQELRQAYEIVLAHLSRPVLAEAEADASPEPLEIADIVAAEPAPVSEPTVDAEPAPGLVGRHWQVCRELHQWIADQHPPADEMDKALAQLLASPMMENLSVRAETERGLAHTILGFAPHADGLIGRCIAFFGWNASVGQFGSMPEARAVVQRAETLRFALELARKSHAHHRAYELMKRPAPTGPAAAVAIARHRGNVRDFFRYASRQAPGIFHEFPGESVEFWARHGGNSKPLLGRFRLRFRASAFSVLMLILLARIVIMAAGAATSGSGAPAPPSSMDMRTSTLAVINDRALEELKSGEVTKARQDYEFALGQYPDDGEALFGRGIARVAAGDDAGNADKLAGLRSLSGLRQKFADAGLPAAELMVFDTAPTIVRQPRKKPILPAGLSLKAPFSVEVRCLVSIDGDLHDCARHAPVPSDQEALANVAINYVRTAKAAPGRYMGAPVADAPIILNATLGSEKRPS